MRDEPGIGAFVVSLEPGPQAGTAPLDGPALQRLRATRRIVADRAQYVLELAVTLAPPVHQGVAGAEGQPEPG